MRKAVFLLIMVLTSLICLNLAYSLTITPNPVGNRIDYKQCVSDTTNTVPLGTKMRWFDTSSNFLTECTVENLNNGFRGCCIATDGYAAGDYLVKYSYGGNNYVEPTQISSSALSTSTNRMVTCLLTSNKQFCTANGKNCGLIRLTDACSNSRTASCGSCLSGSSCNSGTCSCVHHTCADLGKTCGNWDDGCGGKLDCNQRVAGTNCVGECDYPNDASTMCTVITAAQSCPSGYNKVLYMSGQTNAHLALDAGDYGFALCCSGAVLDPGCSIAGNTPAVKLSAATNAHAELYFSNRPLQNYPEQVCVKTSDGKPINCGMTRVEGSKCFLSLSNGTNAHAEDCALTNYFNDIYCCQATPETCDGKDNDCDGITDEGCACDSSLDSERTCGFDPAFTVIGQCEYGLQRCINNVWADECLNSVTPSIEVCDGIDNNCNGAIDEGVTNAYGTCGAVVQETCDGQDNDCDGATDEGVLNACGGCGTLPVANCRDTFEDVNCDGVPDGMSANCKHQDSCAVFKPLPAPGSEGSKPLPSDPTITAACPSTTDCVADFDKDGTAECYRNDNGVTYYTIDVTTIEGSKKMNVSCGDQNLWVPYGFYYDPTIQQCKTQFNPCYVGDEGNLIINKTKLLEPDADGNLPLIVPGSYDAVVSCGFKQFDPNWLTAYYLYPTNVTGCQYEGNPKLVPPDALEKSCCRYTDWDGIFYYDRQEAEIY